jgi:hypothetical protein
MIYPLVTDLADEGIPVAVTCRVLGFSRQGYFKWRAKPICDRDLSDAYLINDAIDAHRRPRLRLSVHLRRARGPRPCGVREPGAAPVLLAAHLVGAFEETGHSTANPGRRSTTTWSSGTSRHGDQHVVVDRHLRTPDRRRQALPLCHQGRLLQLGSSAIPWMLGCRQRSPSMLSTMPQYPRRGQRR